METITQDWKDRCKRVWEKNRFVQEKLFCGVDTKKNTPIFSKLTPLPLEYDYERDMKCQMPLGRAKDENGVIWFFWNNSGPTLGR